MANKTFRIFLFFYTCSWYAQNVLAISLSRSHPPTTLNLSSNPHITNSEEDFLVLIIHMIYPQEIFSQSQNATNYDQLLDATNCNENIQIS